MSAFSKLLARSLKEDAPLQVPTSSSLSSASNPDPKSDSVSKYRRLLQAQASPPPNYDLNVMATTMLNPRNDLRSEPSLADDTLIFDELTSALSKQAITDSINESAPIEGVAGSLEQILKADKDGFIHPFGNPKTTNFASTRALLDANQLKSNLNTCITRLEQLKGHEDQRFIQSELGDVEAIVKSAGEKLPLFRRDAVLALRQEIEDILRILRESIIGWCRDFPDNSPLKIDNRKAFINPAIKRHTPTLLAYCLALTNRVFEGAAKCGSSFMLKALKIFGYSLTLLNEGPNLEQQRALADIPETIDTVEDHFNLHIVSIPYAVCPTCSCTFEPSYPSNSSTPHYPESCNFRAASESDPCGTSLLKYDRPIKTFHYYPFSDWFGRFLALPGIQEIGEKFCEEVAQNSNPSADKRDA
ncbi:hypothetical protein EV361DRAFT_955386 [Lentinula raphanica]|nr:hypothetical protein EV361DRAFT_955386 [Lentinula raphanica]